MIDLKAQFRYADTRTPLGNEHDHPPEILPGDHFTFEEILFQIRISGGIQKIILLQHNRRELLHSSYCKSINIGLASPLWLSVPLSLRLSFCSSLFSVVILSSLFLIAGMPAYLMSQVHGLPSIPMVRSSSKLVLALGNKSYSPRS